MRCELLRSRSNFVLVRRLISQSPNKITVARFASLLFLPTQSTTIDHSTIFFLARVWISKDMETYAHMATAAVMKTPPKGHVIVVAWQSSSKFEGAGDQSILTSESHDGGETWTEPRTTVPPVNGVPVWGPILYSSSSSSSSATSAAAATSSITIRSGNDNTSGELLLIYSRSRPTCMVPGRQDRCDSDNTP